MPQGAGGFRHHNALAPAQDEDVGDDQADPVRRRDARDAPPPISQDHLRINTCADDAHVVQFPAVTRCMFLLMLMCYWQRIDSNAAAPTAGQGA